MRRILAALAACLTTALLCGVMSSLSPPTGAANAPLLPGEATFSGGSTGLTNVPSFDFGSNDTINYATPNFDTQPAIQSQVKAGGLTLDRMWAYGSDGDASILARVTAAQAAGMTCMFMLGQTDQLTWMEHVVSITDNYCHYYEFGNEPDAGNNPNGSNMTTYTNWWIADVPVLRSMFPGTYYGGPTLTWSGGGSVNGYPDSMAYFLSATAAAGVRADFITYHDYPCQAGKQDTTAACIANTAQDFAWNYNNVTQYETQYYGGIIPTGVTEYNFDAGDQHLYDWGGDGTFMSQWTTTAIDAIVATGMSFANQFDLDSDAGYGNYDMFNGTTAKPQFTAMTSEVAKYGGSGVVTQPTAPNAPAAPTATAGNAQATVTWTAPYNGGDPITGYTVTASTGQVVTTTATNATVTGLTNGTPVTFTVTATNAVGTSAASPASNSVTPVAPGTCAAGQAQTNAGTCVAIPTGRTTLAFDDEFAASAVDPQWTVLNVHGDRSNNEPECFLPQQVTQAGGVLKETVAAQSTTCPTDTSNGGSGTIAGTYASGAIQASSFNFTYGTLVARAKMAGGTGPWPDIWLLGSQCQQPDWLTTSTCNWPNAGSQEIDIAEILNSNHTQVNQQIHTSSSTAGCYPTTTDVSANWHTYKLNWTPGKLVFSIDGKNTCTVRVAINTPMFPIVNLAVGGVGGGTINNATLPQATQLDYVRIFQ